jgi:HEAT repeat protein
MPERLVLKESPRSNGERGVLRFFWSLMRPPKRPKPSSQPDRPQERSPEERARNLLLRLETDGPNPVQAAEELDRLQPSLARAARLDRVREAVSDLVEAWSENALRGDRARAWLVLVGGFGLAEHVTGVAELVEDPGLPAPLRMAAARALGGFKDATAVQALLRVTLARGDAQVRAATAEGLAVIGDRSVRPDLEPLLDEDLPRGLWNTVSATVDRLR